MGTYSFEQPVEGRGARRGVKDDAVHRLAQALVQRGDDLLENLLLGIEVVVEGPVGEAGALGDVRDPRLEETVLLEDLLGGVEKPRSRLNPFSRSRAIGGLAVHRPHSGTS